MLIYSIRRRPLMHIIFARLIITIVFIAALFIFLTSRANMRHHDPATTNRQPKYRPIRPELPPTKQRRADPIKWLEQYSNNKYAVSEGSFPYLRLHSSRPKPRVAIISLVRNQGLEGMKQSMRQIEYRWNRKYQYPWVSSMMSLYGRIQKRYSESYLFAVLL